MGEDKDSRRRGRPPISAAAKAAFAWAIRAGASREEAAEAGGYALNSFYRAARRDPKFRKALDEAHAASAEAERSFAIPPEEGEARIVSNNRRVFQRRKMRHVRFDERRQELFLAHFCWSADTRAAAAAAGVCENTVYNYRRRNREFAALFQEALEQSYVRLEAEAVRQRLEAQQRLRDAMEESGPSGEVAAEFERVMKLLARWDRRDGSVGPARRASGQRPAMSFDEAMVLLQRRLRALAIPIAPYPNRSDGEGTGDGEAGLGQVRPVISGPAGGGANSSGGTAAPGEPAVTRS